MLSSFSPAALEAAAQAAPELPRALLLDALHEGWPELLERLGCRALVINHALVDAALVQRVQASGRRLLVYTVNEPSRAAELIGYGIDGLITDAVDRLSPGAR